MSRNPLIEAVHEARYDLETCAERDKPAARKKLFDLLDQAASRANPPVRAEDVLDVLCAGTIQLMRGRSAAFTPLQRPHASARQGVPTPFRTRQRNRLRTVHGKGLDHAAKACVPRRDSSIIAVLYGL